MTVTLRRLQSLSGHGVAAPLASRLDARLQLVIAPSTVHFGPPHPGISAATIVSIADWLIPSVLPPPVPASLANGSASPTLTPIGSTVVRSRASPCESVLRA